jgi:hypothetical protein
MVDQYGHASVTRKAKRWGFKIDREIGGSGAGCPERTGFVCRVD